jgi:lysophospholipase L1-like esterase
MSGDWGKNNQLASYQNVSVKLLANKYSYAFVDLYSALFDIETGGIHAEYTTDGGHLTEEGYEVFTATVRPYIDAALEKFDKSIALS